MMKRINITQYQGRQWHNYSGTLAHLPSASQPPCQPLLWQPVIPICILKSLSLLIGLQPRKYRYCFQHRTMSKENWNAIKLQMFARQIHLSFPVFKPDEEGFAYYYLFPFHSLDAAWKKLFPFKKPFKKELTFD